MEDSALHLRRETPADYRTVEHLVREAFWNVYRPGCLEHYILHRYRNQPDFVPELDLVLEREGRIIGHIMYVRARIRADDGRTIPVMTFAPVSVLVCPLREAVTTILPISVADTSEADTS